MTATKLKLALGAIVVASAATALVVQQQSQAKLRAQNESLTQQLAQLQTDNAGLSNRLTEIGNAKKLSNDQFNELLKLRGEVGVLRRRLEEAGTLREENQRLREEETKLRDSIENAGISFEQAKFNANQVRVVNTMKQLGLAERIYAGDNNDQYTTNFDQMANELGGLYKNPLLDNIEFVNAGIANDQFPQMIIFHERNPRQSPDGSWHRVYGLADGSVQVATSPDGNFSTWEKYDYDQKGTIFVTPQNPSQ